MRRNEGLTSARLSLAGVALAVLLPAFCVVLLAHGDRLQAS